MIFCCTKEILKGGDGRNHITGNNHRLSNKHRRNVEILRYALEGGICFLAPPLKSCEHGWSVMPNPLPHYSQFCQKHQCHQCISPNSTEIASARESYCSCCCPEALGRRRNSAGMAVATAGKQLALFYKVQKGSLSGAQRTSTSNWPRNAAGRFQLASTYFQHSTYWANIQHLSGIRPGEICHLSR